MKTVVKVINDDWKEEKLIDLAEELKPLVSKFPWLKKFIPKIAEEINEQGHYYDDYEIEGNHVVIYSSIPWAETMAIYVYPDGMRVEVWH